MIFAELSGEFPCAKYICASDPCTSFDTVYSQLTVRNISGSIGPFQNDNQNVPVVRCKIMVKPMSYIVEISILCFPLVHQIIGHHVFLALRVQIG